MAVNRLRWLLSDEHIRGFRRVPWLLDKDATDPLSQERTHRIYTQLTAAVVLKAELLLLGIETGNVLDLEPLIREALFQGVINGRVAAILRVVNHQANDAKHCLVFRPRM